MRRITPIIVVPVVIAMWWWTADATGRPAGATAGAAPSRSAMLAPTPLPATYLREVTLLGTQLNLGWTRDAKSNFVLLTPRDNRAAGITTAILDNIYQRFCQSFMQAGFDLQPPAAPLTWICFATREDFDRYARSVDRSDLWWSRGYYSTRTNRVAIFRSSDAQNEDLTELAHEAAHQLAYNTGLQKRGVMYPVWVSEGIATNLETAMSVASPLTTLNARRCQVLRNARLIPLSQLIGWTSVPVDDQQATENAYAQVWGLFHFLLNRKGPELHKYMQALGELPTGQRNEMQLRQEFIHSFGRVDALDAQFRQYVAALGAETTIASEGPAPR